jgi:hypothetical protein
MQSGSATYNARPSDPEASWKNLTTGMNCNNAKDVIKCMRAVDAVKMRDYSEQSKSYRALERGRDI